MGVRKKWRRKKSEPARFSDSVTILQRHSPVVKALSLAIAWQHSLANSKLRHYGEPRNNRKLPGEIGSTLPEFLALTKHALGQLDTWTPAAAPTPISWGWQLPQAGAYSLSDAIALLLRFLCSLRDLHVSG